MARHSLHLKQVKQASACATYIQQLTRPTVMSVNHSQSPSSYRFVKIMMHLLLLDPSTWSRSLLHKRRITLNPSCPSKVGILGSCRTWLVCLAFFCLLPLTESQSHRNNRIDREREKKPHQKQQTRSTEQSRGGAASIRC